MEDKSSHTNVDRVFPVFQYLRHYERVDVSSVFPVLIVLHKIKWIHEICQNHKPHLGGILQLILLQAYLKNAK